MLIASRPIAIKARQQSVPDNFTVMTVAAGDQTAKPLEEAKHGMFSYFLMKGMEGETREEAVERLIKVMESKGFTITDKTQKTTDDAER